MWSAFFEGILIEIAQKFQNKSLNVLYIQISYFTRIEMSSHLITGSFLEKNEQMLRN
jgi:hypothetical protein